MAFVYLAANQPTLPASAADPSNWWARRLRFLPDRAGEKYRRTTERSWLGAVKDMERDTSPRERSTGFHTIKAP